jgi:hypothetical protein
MIPAPSNLLKNRDVQALAGLLAPLPAEPVLEPVVLPLLPVFPVEPVEPLLEEDPVLAPVGLLAVGVWVGTEAQALS